MHYSLRFFFLITATRRKSAVSSDPGRTSRQERNFDTEEDESKKMNTETVTVTHKAAAIYSSFQERLVYKKNRKRHTEKETIKSG